MRLAPESGLDRRRRRLLEHLLVAPLERAVALAEVDAVAVGVEQDLDLDVARTLEEALEDQSLVAEGRLRLASRRRQLGREIGRIADGPHPLAAAAGRRLDEDRDSRSVEPRSIRAASVWSASS